MGFSRQEYWSGLPCPLPGDLPDSGIKPTSHVSCIAGEFFTTSAACGEGNGTPSSALAWKIPWMEEPGGLQSMGSLGVEHD